MAEISFDLGDLFEKAFGYKTMAFYPAMRLIKGNGPEKAKVRPVGASGSPYYKEGLMGREHFMPVKLSYIHKDPKVISSSTGKVAEVSKEWDLPHPVISISSKKTIVETPLTERRGTVKELISIQDYDIVIKGLIVNTSNEYPEDAVTMLRTIYEQNTPVSIKCPLTDIFLLRPDRGGSDQVVITELKLPVIPGVKHVCSYELHLLSDAPFNLISLPKAKK